MMSFFNRKKGAISVFLTLVMVPVLVFACLVTDASKIYASKAFISDAGELTMNAALAQYDSELLDAYGLLAMEKDPETIQSDLEKYFVTSLNSSNVPSASNYEQIISMMSSDFQSLHVQNTEIYRNEVEKQQILEYMKYRAPVCMADLIIDKFSKIKDAKKMAAAMEAQMDFSEAMEDCNDAFEDAVKSLEELQQCIDNYGGNTQLEAELNDTYLDFGTSRDNSRQNAYRFLIMYEFCIEYDEKSTNLTINEAAKSYTNAAKKVSMSSDFYYGDNFNKYVSSLYFANTVDSLGGIDKVDDETIRNNYKEQKKRLENYKTDLLSLANNTIKKHHENLGGYLQAANLAQVQATSTHSKLLKVKEKLEEAQKKYDVWDNAAQQLESKNEDGSANEMQKKVKEYADFFGQDMTPLNDLMETVEGDKIYFGEIYDIILKEKFYGMSIAKVDTSTQISTYRAKADKLVEVSLAYGVSEDDPYLAIEDMYKNNFEPNYEHVQTVETTEPLMGISNDPFYLKLKEYCKKNAEDKSKAKKYNEQLGKGKQGAEDAKDDTAYPTYDWSKAGVTLPSSILSGKERVIDGSAADLDADSDITKKSSRRSIIKKYKESIKAASSFLDAIDRLINDNVEELYIAEYAMQMTSYYTIDKKVESGKVQTISKDKVFSLSGRLLGNSPAYKAECEYILWGNKSSKTNIQNTVMMIFGIRLLFNCFFAFTDSTIVAEATEMATAIAGAAPYLIPIVQTAIILAIAGAETAVDISKIKQGYGVTIVKTSKTFTLLEGDNTQGVTLDYSEYLRIFMNMTLLAGNESSVLARIADCIQINTKNDITKEYTMVSVQSKIKVKTVFMKSIADWSGASWNYDNDGYTVEYQSILGY